MDSKPLTRRERILTGCQILIDNFKGEEKANRWGSKLCINLLTRMNGLINDFIGNKTEKLEQEEDSEVFFQKKFEETK